MKYIKNKSENSIVDVRYDIMGVFDCRLSNPNGDPNADNYPRTTMRGLGYTTDMCLKRKIRDFVFETMKGQPGYRIYINDDASYESKQMESYIDIELDVKSKKSEEQEKAIYDFMVKNFFDVRAFGAVLNTTQYKIKNAIGPVQADYPETLDNIILVDNAIICKGLRNDKDKDEKKEGANTQMGSKKALEYGAYVFALSVNPYYAQYTGFTYGDLDILIDAIVNMFAFRTASKTGMTVQKLWVLEHPDKLGIGQFGKIKKAIKAIKKYPDEIPNCYEDYESIFLDRTIIDSTINILDIIE